MGQLRIESSPDISLPPCIVKTNDVEKKLMLLFYHVTDFC
jgi:hypothetical protein